MFLRIFVCLLLVGILASADAKNAQRDFIIDTDLGIDDVLAMIYLMQQPDIRVKAITIEGDGAAHCRPAFKNTQYVLSLLNKKNIPIACGRTIPLNKGAHKLPDDILHDSDTLAGISLPKINQKFPHITAKDLLIKTLKQANHPVNILAIGPLTNLAEVFDADPSLIKKISMIYMMGGAVKTPGNIHEVDPRSANVTAEWNIYLDPYAADKVFRSGVAIMMIPLDVTNKAELTQQFEKLLNQSHSKIADFVYQLVLHNRLALQGAKWYFWDPMASVIATHEEIATIEKLPLSVQQRPEKMSGAIIIDAQYGTPVQVCTDINNKKFVNLLLKGLS
jgi:pyrimidine-specific ribonucleoside hydrolase